MQLIFKDIDISSCGAEADPCGAGEIPQLPYSWWSMSLLCSSTSLRGAQVFSHGPDASSEDRVSPVSLVCTVLGQVSLARRCATTGAGVGPDSVQLLDKIGDMPVVGPHGPDSAQAGRDSTGAVLGQGHGHARCGLSWPRQS